MSAHAMLGASSAKRWMACTPSAFLEAEMPQSSSRFADEGTLAHRLAELHLRKWSEAMKPSVFKKTLAEIQAHELYKPDMAAFIMGYVDFVKSKFTAARDACPDALLALETRLDYSDWVPEGFGTGDVLIIADGTLEVIDLKYGQGVAVDAVDNPQIRLYGAGAFAHFGMLYDIERVRLTIHQPRLDSVSTEELELSALLDWLDTEVRPKAVLAAEGLGEFNVGEHCRFCRAKAVCKARAGVALAVADFKDQPVELLSPEEIADILPMLKVYDKWSTDLKDYALKAALVDGLKFPGYKLVEGRSNRVIVDPPALADRLLLAGVDRAKVYAPEAVLGLGKLEKNIGKDELASLAGELIIKPAGAPALVEFKDSRPELNSLENARADFAENVETDE